MSAVLPPSGSIGEAAGAATRRRRDAGFGDFFRYHGWLSPGVRLFRQLGFPAKSLCIGIAFVLPLVVMLVSLVNTGLDQISASRRPSAPASP